MVYTQNVKFNTPVNVASEIVQFYVVHSLVSPLGVWLCICFLQCLIIHCILLLKQFIFTFPQRLTTNAQDVAREDDGASGSVVRRVLHTI